MAFNVLIPDLSSRNALKDFEKKVGQVKGQVEPNQQMHGNERLASASGRKDTQVQQKNRQLGDEH